MQDGRKTKAQLLEENAALRQRISELESQCLPQALVSITPDVTNHEQIEAALRASEEKFRSVMEQASEAMALFDEQSRCVEVNLALERLTGVPRAEWLGLTAWEINLRFMPEDQRTPEAEARFKAQVQRLAAGQAAQLALAHEFALSLPSGAIRNVRMTVFPIRLAHGTMLGSILFDITERKQAEEQIQQLNFELEQRVIERTLELQTLNETMQTDIRQRQRIEEMLRRSEQRYRTLFESAGDAIFLADLNGQIIEVNHMACQQLGYTADQLKGQSLSLLDASPEIASVDERIHRLRRTGEQVFEALHRRRDGSLMPVEIKSCIIEYAGHPAILGIVRDVSERKRAGQALHRYSEEQAALYHIALALNSQLDVKLLLRLIVEQATILLSAQAGGIYLYEPRHERLTLVVGVDYFNEYLGTELKPGEGLSGRVFQTRQITTVQDYRTWEGRAAPYANDTRLTAMIAVPLLSKQAVLGVLVVGGDQGKPVFDDHDTELVELFATQAATALENAQLLERQQEQYQHLQAAQARLIQSEKMSALGRLIASISHEINNPLQAVQGCLTLIREGVEEELPRLEGVETEPWLHDLEVASTEVQRIATIVQRLRDFYRTARPGLQATDIAATINSVLALTAKQLQHSGISVDQAPAAEPPIIVRSNADQLKQVILNLVLNAIDAMPGGGSLRVTAVPDKLWVGDRTWPAARIDFTDTGTGILPDHLPRIFEPFFTTKDTGSGLGLSISYELIKALGGELSVTSRVGVGTTFTVHLRLDPEDETGSAP